MHFLAPLGDTLRLVYKSLTKLSVTVPSKASTVAARLKVAGAILLGKTNLSRWSGFPRSNFPLGWSSRGGHGTAAYFPNQNPFRRQLAGRCHISWPSLSFYWNGDQWLHCRQKSSHFLSLAKFEGFRILKQILPAHKSNLCAVKCTVGLVLRSMVIPISSTQDTVRMRTLQDQKGRESKCITYRLDRWHVTVGLPLRF